jgi:signal transduction histidine kinase
MPSPKTDPGSSTTASRWERFDPRSTAALFQRLNVRLVFILSLVALVGLIVSGVAITQILPGYFTEQTQERVQTAADSTAILLRDQINRASEDRPNAVAVPELRDTLVVPPVARFAAGAFNATVSIINDEGRAVVTASPQDEDALMAEGLRRDTDVEPARTAVEVRLPDGSETAYLAVVSDPFTSRAETLEQIRGALLFGGWLALLVSLVTGVIAARGVTVPISRLRGVARSLGQGQLDERAEPSGVLEIDELGHQFNVMADRLSGTLRMLEADRDRLREFVADVSHELRTPIAALRMYSELQSSEIDDATRAEFLERSIEQVGRLEWLSTNLLDLSRIDAGIFPLDMQIGDLRDPVQAVVQALSEEALARGISLDSAVPARPVELRFDRERIVQLMTNLVGNALKFTPPEGGVSVRLDDLDDQVEILVRDTGPGIPEGELPHIFERFYRGTNTGEARASGSGLGLAIARSIVEMHAGTIDVSSRLGEGTEFRIVLPREDLELEVAHEAANVNETSRGSSPARNPGTVA